MFQRILPLIAVLVFSTTSAQAKSLIDKNYIRDCLTHEAPWCTGHNAKDDYLGCGMLYYTMAYIQRAKLCVCLGSGGGFVPRVMRQAQRDLNLTGSKTFLVDGNIGNFGRPQWLSQQSFFRTCFPDINIIIDLTSNVARRKRGKWQIDYLHIDADHSYEGAYQDFIDYLPLMKKGGIITFHDTNGSLPCAKVIPELQKQGYQIVNFKDLGAGVAIIYLP